jgi:hypothetical protein
MMLGLETNLNFKGITLKLEQLEPRCPSRPQTSFQPSTMHGKFVKRCHNQAKEGP